VAKKKHLRQNISPSGTVVTAVSDINKFVTLSAISRAIRELGRGINE